MLCISISKSYIRYFSVDNNDINSINTIELENKIDFNTKTADYFYKNISAVFDIIEAQKEEQKDIALSLPAKWTDLSIYNIDPGLSEKDKLNFFQWQNYQKYGSQSATLTFQYYPIEDNNSSQYLVVAYPNKLKNKLIQSALRLNFQIKFIDIDVFALLKSIRYMQLDKNISRYAIWLSDHKNSNHSILIIEKNKVSNYIEINSQLKDSPIVKNAKPVKKNIAEDIFALMDNQPQKIKYLSHIFMVSGTDSTFSQKFPETENDRITFPKIKENTKHLDSVTFRRHATGLSQFIDVFGLFVRGVIPK